MEMLNLMTAMMVIMTKVMTILMNYLSSSRVSWSSLTRAPHTMAVVVREIPAWGEGVIMGSMVMMMVDMVQGYIGDAADEADLDNVCTETWQLKMTGQEAVVSFSMATIWSKFSSAGAISWFMGILMGSSLGTWQGVSAWLIES